MAKKTINIGTSVNKGDGDPLRTAFGKINDNFDEIYGAIATDGTIFNPLSVDSHLLPDTDNTRDLGSPAKRWRDIFVAPGSLYIGDIKLSNDSGTLVVQQVTDAGLVTETPVPGAPGSVTTDRLVNGAKEVVLTGGANPYVTFPTVASGENIIIQGAEIASANGAVAITSSDSVVINTNALTALNTWTFGDDGNLELPPGFINTNQVTGLNLRSGYDVHIISNHADVDREWVLDSYGDLTLPGGIKSEGAINIDINLSDSTLRRWTFTEGGDLRFPDGTSQSTAFTGGGLPTVVNASFSITDASFTPEGSLAETPYSITVTPSSTSAPVSITFNLSIVANTGEENAGYQFKIYVNGSPVNSSEIINFIDDSPTTYSAYPVTYTFNFVPGTNSPTTIALWAAKTGSNGWKFSKALPSKHVVTALVF